MIDDKFILSNNSGNLDQIASQEKSNYQNAFPYPHITLKKFFKEEFLNSVLEEFPNLQNINESEKYSNKNEVKFSYNNYENFPNKIKGLFDFLNSKTFL